ncbi:DnaJ C-terminal domain-containing protein [Oleisolibacter albus]|uniref:DnaJ C-terminal domain-containing protein n=1 Tax=Oleisolibacter albus TaxID=2171757 RepID=UPI000DF4444F|nr:J domain-containing protein [Oleisolibacter albus]
MRVNDSGDVKSTDPYDVLGVARTADAAAIKTAYRKLAKRWHPDLNPGDAAAAERFKQISAAYDLLSDPEKKTRFDRGEIDASGQEQAPRGFYRDFAEGPGGTAYGSEQPVFDEDLFADLFGGLGAGPRGAGGHRHRRGADVSYSLRIDFLDAVNGARRRLTLPDGRALEVTIPPGTQDRQTLRLKGQGQPGLGGGPAGDAYVEVHVQPHAWFTRKDSDIHLDLPVSLTEAVLGGKVPVPTISGEVMLTIPRGSNTGTVLRLRGRGVPGRGTDPAGDQYVRLKVLLPEGEDADLARFVEGWAGRTYDVRSKAGMKP